MLILILPAFYLHYFTVEQILAWDQLVIQVTCHLTESTAENRIVTGLLVDVCLISERIEQVISALMKDAAAF